MDRGAPEVFERLGVGGGLPLDDGLETLLDVAVLDRCLSTGRFEGRQGELLDVIRHRLGALVNEPAGGRRQALAG